MDRRLHRGTVDPQHLLLGILPAGLTGIMFAALFGAVMSRSIRYRLGVHGPIKSHYRIDAKDLPLPVDYQVAATGA
ncbi:hypothetical protein [Candidatus Palauibacter sp.]|uniref:hypothetical protein n=1 Tax=Candidatus Palauibacter sp. TaxID=3101350 RepID=UPI003B5BB5CB